MNYRNTKYLIFDVDNTITESCQEITQKMNDILTKINLEVAFISGTNISELKRMISSKLKRRHHLLGNTGTHYLIVENYSEKEILKEELSKEEKEEIISAIKKLKEKYSLIPLTTEEDQIQDRGSQITLSILGRNAPFEEKYTYDKTKKKREKFVRFIEEFLKDKYEINIGGTTSIDITKKGKDKCSGIKKFMKINDIKKEEIIFFGDQLKPGGNDYPVKKIGVRCIEVKDQNHTFEILKNFYKTKGIMI